MRKTFSKVDIEGLFSKNCYYASEYWPTDVKQFVPALKLDELPLSSKYPKKTLFHLWLNKNQYFTDLPTPESKQCLFKNVAFLPLVVYDTKYNSCYFCTARYQTIWIPTVYCTTVDNKLWLYNKEIKKWFKLVTTPSTFYDFQLIPFKPKSELDCYKMFYDYVVNLCMRHLVDSK